MTDRSVRDRVEEWSRTARVEVAALLLAYRHPGTPWYAKALAALVVAYALSPVDLIPDFVPVLGLLDDLILVPLGIVAARRLVPADVLDECRRRARLAEGERPSSRYAAAALIVASWIAFGAGLALLVWRLTRP